ncbi:hypothetical protein Skr01_26750 [Sphaerisporangium krabiense]|uniref:CopG-like ribbon-helix-helix domain-containing protein n=1 Tax=Sphaerisporangium krabiense TaxID=763782 RepID=A0A7W9DTB4_9ACTN|nr:hypothetical protein [Sphaerisporangium krabiense]MBB5630458.1 hypothetical protein [Sphaerisporangium krabiense]GII62590.1 hypothetical protein Skr01_26750 [Sphaerisporangium krabiense]
MSERKKILLRLDPAVYDAIVKWAGDELRSANAQIEFLLRKALGGAGRLPADAKGMPRRGRPRKTPAADGAAGGDEVTDVVDVTEDAGTAGDDEEK